MKIKTRISFDEYRAVVKKVINDTFTDNVYSPAYYDISLRTALLNAYAPEYAVDDTDNNTLYGSVYSCEAKRLFNKIKRKKQYHDIIQAINNGINFRKDLITSGGMSMSDIALANLIDKFTEVVEKLGDNLDVETTKKFVESVTTMKDGITAENMVNALINTGMIGDKK